LAALAQLLLQPARRSRGAIGDSDRNIGFFLAADAGEKLI
jgi:hypothetical protein